MPDNANEPTSLVGCRYGALLVIAPAPRSTKMRYPAWICRCDCGNERTVSINRLEPTNGSATRSCGCGVQRFLDLAGVRFGMLVARERVAPDGKRQGSRWRCECDCGRFTVSRTKDLRDVGNTTSCGCRINRPVVTRDEVSPRQLDMLAAIATAGGELPQKGLEAVLGTHPGRVSYNVTRVERRGLVRRVRRRPRGGGSWLAVVLTPAGRMFLRRGAAVPAEARAA